MLEESVVYQDILRKGEQRGFVRGAQQEGTTIILRQLERRFGKLSPSVRRKVAGLTVAQLEEISLALLRFRKPEDVLAWFKQHAAKG